MMGRTFRLWWIVACSWYPLRVAEGGVASKWERGSLPARGNTRRYRSNGGTGVVLLSSMLRIATSYQCESEEGVEKTYTSLAVFNDEHKSVAHASKVLTFLE
jgi:hypothetical protein